MRRLVLSLMAGAGAIAAGGIAYAQAASPAGGELTRAEVQQRAATAFGRMDANGDGKLDPADREARRKARFERIDADSDGAINYAEFTAVHGKRGGDRAERGERDGHRVGQRHARRLGAFFGAKADADDNGAIAPAEFQAAALRRFDRVDADGNGAVTREERKAARDAMRQQRRARRGVQAN